MIRKYLLLLSYGMLVAQFAYCHPPSDIKINFDEQTKIVKAEILHNTTNPDKHFIGKVDVHLNGKEIISQKISKQENPKSQHVIYLITDVKKGDNIAIEAYCSVGGILKKTMTVGK
ncbi:MAG: hypothetical protein ACP5JO_08915 [Candidatus Ratteibacteria bacterium]